MNLKYFLPLNFKSFRLACWLGLVLPLLALALAGCAGTDNTAVMAPPPANYPGDPAVARLHVGDTITVTLDGLPDTIPTHEEAIKEDGSINLDLIGHVKAAGRTAGELQDAIHDLYVPKYYTHVTVTVKTGDRVFYVRGEVKGPGRQIYVGQITVSIGFSEVRTGDSPSGAFERADKAVYYAKEHGRNQVCSYAALVARGELDNQASNVGDMELF